MDIRNFVTFNTVVEVEGFTKAAEKLNYAQSTVTLHIKELETHYKKKIFDRISKKIYLTSFGKSLYNKSLRLVKEYHETLQHSETTHKEVLRIGVYESLLKYRLMSIISDFKKSHPHVDIVIKHGICKALREDIRKGDLDLTFQIEPQRTFSDMTITTLCKEQFYLIFPKNETLENMQADNRIIYFTEEGCSYRKLFEQYLDEKGVRINQVMETGSTDLIKQYVALGLGYSMVPAITILEEDQQTIMIEKFPTKEDLFTQLLYHKDKHVFGAMYDFIELVRTTSELWS